LPEQYLVVRLVVRQVRLAGRLNQHLESVH
jgi:hypothetical protein